MSLRFTSVKRHRLPRENTEFLSISRMRTGNEVVPTPLLQTRSETVQGR